MFGFIRPKALDLKTATPAAQASGILITREDIYRENKGLEPILLLRKGCEVAPEELPRFIRNGAKPHQFQFKHSPADMRPVYQPPAKPEPPPARILRLPRQISHTPGIPTGLPPRVKEAERKKVLILDPDTKSMKRLIDCLFICGIPLDHIHPVRMAVHLDWAADKYRPHILVVDYQCLGILPHISALPWLEQCILTITPQQSAGLSPTQQAALQALCSEHNVKILEKPVNRHTLSRLLHS